MKFKMTVDGKTHDIEVLQQNTRSSPSPVTLSIDGKTFTAAFIERDEKSGIMRLKVNEKEFKVGLEDQILTGGKPVNVSINEIPFEVNIITAVTGIQSAANKTALEETGLAAKAGHPPAKTAQREVSAGGKVIRPPMPGKIISIKVKEGEPVKTGDVVLILEAMKMANEITSPYSGNVKEVRVSNGQSVTPEETLIVIE